MDLLDDYRLEIDRIDREITKLFEQRMNISKKVANHKIKNNLEIYQKDREEKVIDKNISYLEEKEYGPLLRGFYINLMYLSRLTQKKELNKSNLRVNLKDNKRYYDVRVGYQGVKGSFSEEAMHKHFDRIKYSKGYDKFEDVFLGLKNNEVDYIVVPIENSSTGGISKVYDLLNQYKCYIVGEECIKINQHLLGINGATLSDIKEVYSHPQGFEQSNKSLQKYKNLKLIPYLNTAISAKLVSDSKDKTKAAIASERAAKIYNLEIIERNINDIEDNYTKFAIIGNNLEINDECNKSSVVFSIEHEAGSLYNLLRYFSEYKINLTKIESRPNKHIPWRYLFYVDFEGNIDDKMIKDGIKVIENESKYFKFLGSYKKCDITK